ncbi:hypothetical protein Slin15195_G038460 [Septoria linicola]|uniref:Uncharacterized protein n=1 Tax=Septoria linicola TaxID=215465 RepID=A0A9Q9AJJ4_9PEZI|nr:hypothetical protein Slin14017_G119860 [Septoria linicola]USW50527.1 hypothetical protein Slin15195_G038460 [Septoria linicola]
MVTFSAPEDSPPRTPNKRTRTSWRDPDPRHAPSALYGAETPSPPSSHPTSPGGDGVPVMPMSEVRAFVRFQSSQNVPRLSAIPENLNGPSQHDPNYIPQGTIPGVPKYTPAGERRAEVTDQYEDVFQDPGASSTADALYSLAKPRRSQRRQYGSVRPYGTKSSSPKGQWVYTDDRDRTLEEAADAGGEPAHRGVTAARREGGAVAGYDTSKTAEEWLEGGARPGSKNASKRRRVQ